jgi:hypothetical protein
MENSNETETTIDDKINAAKARRAKRVNVDGETPRVKRTPEERAAAKLLRDAELEQKRLERAEARAAKQSMKPVHMTKVERAATKLPTLSDDARQFFNDAVSGLSSIEQVSALAQNLAHHVRVAATESSVGVALTVGMEVTINSGAPAEFIGKTATISKAQRIRCYVTVGDRELYLYNSDVTPSLNVDATAVA